MAPFRNLFSKRPDVQTGLQPAEENVRAVSPNGIRPTFEKVDTTGSRSSSISINKPQEPPEYKMSGMWQPLACVNMKRNRLINPFSRQR